MASEGKSTGKPMSLRELVVLVNHLDRMDYDCKLAKYPKLKIRKDNILQQVVAVLQRKCGVTRTKCQLRKRWSDLKNRNAMQLEYIRRVISHKRGCLAGKRKALSKRRIKLEPGEDSASSSRQIQEEEQLRRGGRRRPHRTYPRAAALRELDHCMTEMQNLKASISSAENELAAMRHFISTYH